MPDSITVKGKEIALKNLRNPLRADSANLKKLVREGGEIYFKNCFLCHGDLLDGSGVFGDRFFPKPANFTAPQSILSKPESYAYWRIMKGGKGLPKDFNPWDSAMPAWEDTLSEDQAWKTILFIYETAGETWKRPEGSGKPSVERGKEIYYEKCAYCHGETGDGAGPAASYTSPRPRKLSKAQYKIRTTPFGKIPTDDDIFNIITEGMPGTTMPAWRHLPESDRRSLVLYLKTLSDKFEKFYAKGEILESVVAGDPPAITAQSLARGKDLFLKNCSGCHGLLGRNDGESTKRVVNVASDAIWPRNLTKPWLFRRGSSRKDIFLTVRTGLSGTAMPMFGEKSLKDDQVWDLVNYVQTLSLSEKPAVRNIMMAAKISGRLPLDPEDPLWKTVDSNYFPLGGQIVQSEKAYYPTADGVVVKAIHNGNEIAFYLRWDDPTFDPILQTLTSVKESPPPPVSPGETQGAAEQQAEQREEESEKPEPQEFPDAIALQFPVSPGGNGERPYFLNGDPSHPVNLWKWDSYPMRALELNAKGMDKISEQPKESQEVASKAIYRYGSYYVVMKRKLTTADKGNDVQFQQGPQIPVAFNIWNGSDGETGSKKAISSWFQIVLE